MAGIQPPKSQYQQIADLLRNRIDDGTYTPASALPSEPELARELGVSRVTVNRAIGLLRGEGLVRVRRGSGTFVRAIPRILRDARRRFEAREEGSGAGDVEARTMGLRPRTVYTEIGRTAAPPEVAEALDLEAGAAVLVRRRRLYANDEPTQLADSYYPWSLAKGTKLEEEQLGAGGSYSLLRELGRGPARFREDVTVGSATGEEAAALDLEGTVPVIRIMHVAHDADDAPVAVMLHVMPSHLWTLRYEWAADGEA